MKLYGWKYKGRIISNKLHEQFLEIINYLDDPTFIANKDWPTVQKLIAKNLNIKPGQVRTIKRVLEEFCVLKEGSLNGNKIPDATIYTSEGYEFVKMLKLEALINNSKTNDTEMLNKINLFYQYYYLKVLSKPVDSGRGTTLRTLRATLKAIKKFDYLDYWEWYILNTIITEDDNPTQERELEETINKYRNKQLLFTDEDIVENKLSHSYLLGNFKWTGLIETTGSKNNLRIRLNKLKESTINIVINE